MSAVKTLMIGVTVGAILGILYAPDKGSATRRKLSRQGEDLRDLFNDFKDSITDKFESFKSDVDEMAYHEIESVENDVSAKPYSWQS